LQAAAGMVKYSGAVDCGATWDLIYDEGGSVTEIIVDPQNPYIIYANSRGVIRSKDGGTTWQFADEGIPSGLGKIVVSLEIDHVNTRRLYAGTGCPWGPLYLYYTDNRGDSWHPLPGFSFGDTLVNDNHLLHNVVFSLAVNPADNHMLYAGTGSGTGRINYVLHSTDSGMNWNKVISFEDSIPRWFNSSVITFSRDSKYVYVFMRLKGLLKSDVISNGFYEIQMPDSIIQTTQFGMAFNENDNLILCTVLGIFKYDGNVLIDYNNNLPHGDTRALYLTNQNNAYTGLEAKTKGGVYVRRID